MPLRCCSALRPPKARRGALPAEAAITPTNTTAATAKRFDDIEPAPPQGRDLDSLIADRFAQSSPPGTRRGRQLKLVAMCRQLAAPGAWLMDRRAALELWPPRLEERVTADPQPDDIEGGGRVGAVPAAVHHEADRPHDVHQVVGPRVSLELPGRKQRVRPDDESGAGPADDLDGDFHGGPALLLLRMRAPLYRFRAFAAGKACPGSHLCCTNVRCALYRK